MFFPSCDPEGWVFAELFELPIIIEAIASPETTLPWADVVVLRKLSFVDQQLGSLKTVPLARTDRYSRAGRRYPIK